MMAAAAAVLWIWTVWFKEAFCYSAVIESIFAITLRKKFLVIFGCLNPSFSEPILYSTITTNYYDWGNAIDSMILTFMIFMFCLATFPL